MIPLFSVVFFSWINLPVSSATVQEIRIFHEKACCSEKECTLFYNYMNRAGGNEPLTQAYRGVSNIFMARFVWSPWSKYNYFTTGRDLLENAIESDKFNIEMRYLRYTVQTNAPSFLSYNSHINLDKNLILKNWVNLKDEDLKNRISVYMSSDKNLTESERAEFRNFILPENLPIKN